MKNNMRNICFTGHRNVTECHSIIRKLIETLDMLINQGAENFYAGGAVGFDTLCSIVVINMKKIYPEIKLNLILPYKNYEKKTKCGDEQRELISRIISFSDSVEYTSENYTEECMKIRNRRLVELSDCCVCYYSGNIVSGTGQTVRMAVKNEVEIYNLISSKSYMHDFTK